MILRTWIARPLRRFVGTALMLVGTMAVIDHLHLPQARFPRSGADRVTVWDDGAWREIRDPARVRRIAAFIRERQGRDWRAVPEFAQHYSNARAVLFHRGERLLGRVTFAPDVLSVEAGRRWGRQLILDPAESAELQRLLER